MSKFTALSEGLHDYIVEHGSREDDALIRIREQTAELGDLAVMQIAPDQGALMTLLTGLIGARRAIEVGTFTGYSAVCIARGMDTDGLLVACELDPERAEAAIGNFALAGVADRIDLRVGPAVETLDDLVAEGGEPYDLAFIDADKVGYDTYYELCLQLLRPGGLIVIDNVFQGGRVLDPDGDESAEAIDLLNRKLHGDERVRIATIATADGLTLAHKR